MIRLLSASVAVANRAGAVIRDVLKSGQLGVVHKGYDDPQTEADRRAERCIVATLTTRFPHVTIIGEESIPPTAADLEAVVREDSPEVLREACPPDLTSVDEKDVVIWVDPLDGTGEFTKGFHEDVTVLVGIAVEGKPVAGVIHQPFYGTMAGLPTAQQGRTVWGMLGLGVRGIVPRPSPEHGGLRLAVSRSHYSGTVERVTECLQAKEKVIAGGAGNKILMVLENVVDAYIYPSPGTKRWDTCAGDAIVRAAGGAVTDVHGRDLMYDPVTPVPSTGDQSGFVQRCMNSQGVLVAMKGLEDLRAKIPEDVLRSLSK
jgi:3'(2'), 5'-bisphosphate nucleotidase